MRASRWMRCVYTIIPYIDCTPCGNRFTGFFSFFALSAPGLAVRTGRENVIHIVAAVSIIICTAAVEGLEESTAAAWSECKQLIMGKWMFGGRECGRSSLEESSKPVFISDLDALY